MTTLEPRYPPIDVLKSEAKALRHSLAKDGTEVTHSRSLEMLAHWYGARDWNTLSGLARQQRPAIPQVGARTSGRYLGQSFQGEVIGFQKLAQDRARVTIRFDEPVDVVRFDSFSSFRSRVSAVVGPDGRSLAKTGDGQPQMQLDLV